MMNSTADGIVALVCIGLMIFTGGMTGIFFFLLAVFFLCAWSDGHQCLKPKKFKEMIDKARVIANVVGRDL